MVLERVQGRLGPLYIFFDRRHKLLSSSSSVSVEEFQGIVGSDDLFFAYSGKGNRHLDRIPKGKTDKVKVDVPCSDSHRSHGAFTKASTIVHKNPTP